MVGNESSPSSDEGNCAFNDTTLKLKLNVEIPQFKQRKKTSTDEKTSEISGTANKKLKIFHHNISTNSIHQSSTTEVRTTKISTSTSTILSPSTELESDKGKNNFNGFSLIYNYT